MANYFIRVELRGNPSAETYQLLHTFMAARGFYTTVVAQDGSNVALPHATYAGSSDKTSDILSTSLRDGITGSIWGNAIVLVIRYEGWYQAWKE